MAIPAPTPPEIAQGVYEVVVTNKHHDQVVINTYHYRRVSGAAVAADLADLLVAFRALFEGPLSAALSNEASIESYKVAALSDRTLVPAFLNVNVTGAVLLNSLPTGVSGLIRRRSAFGGRSGRGRVFLGGIPSSFELDSNLSAGGIAAIQAVAGLMVQTITGGSGVQYIPCIVSKKSPTTPATFKRASDVTSVVVVTAIAYQRRRSRQRPDIVPV